MLFLSLLVYLALYFPAHLLAHWLRPGLDGRWQIVPLLALLGLSALLTQLFAYLVSVYNPGAKAPLRNLLRITGVRWLGLLTGLLVIFWLVASTLWFNQVPDRMVWGLLGPVLIVSMLNGMGFEVRLKQLDAIPEPGKVVIQPAPPQVQEDIVRTFRWKSQGRDYSLDMTFRRWVYEELKSKPRVLDSSRWSDEYVSDGINGEIRELALGLVKLSDCYGTSQEVTFALDFIRNVTTYQSEQGEYPKYPVETLIECTGDCEDFSILGAAVLKCMGYNVALLLLPGHVALGVAGATGLPGTFVEQSGVRYYYCEMTANGWSLGVMPSKYAPQEIVAVPVPDPAARVVVA